MIRLGCALLTVAVLTSCGSPAAPVASDDVSSSTSGVTLPDVSAPPPTTTLTSDERGVAVIVSGLIEPDGGICPAAQPGCKFAIAVEGDVSGVAAGDFVTGSGWYDGTRLVLAATLTSTDSPFGATPTYDSLCPGMSNPASVDTNRVLEVANPILGRTDGDSDALATAWIDQASNVITLWFARDLDRYRNDLLAAFGEMNVCLAEGARFSERALREAMDQVGQLSTDGAFVVQGGFGTDELANRIVVPIEALDPAGRAALAALDAVVPLAFIELVDRPLADLPPWSSPIAGTVDLMTMSSRTSGGMAALGTFVVQYDAAANCIYWQSADQRGTFVWPFGYTAADFDGTVTVFDGAGERVVAVGEQVEFGGGFVGTGPLTGVTGNNRCGADDVFVVNR